MGAILSQFLVKCHANHFTFLWAVWKTISALFVNLGFQRKLAKFAISMWGKEVLNFYTIVILSSCFCSCPWTVLLCWNTVTVHTCWVSYGWLIASWWWLKRKKKLRFYHLCREKKCLNVAPLLDREPKKKLLSVLAWVNTLFSAAASLLFTSAPLGSEVFFLCCFLCFSSCFVSLCVTWSWFVLLDIWLKPQTGNLYCSDWNTAWN